MKSLSLGSNLIDFNLIGVDGKHYTLADFADKKYIALIFSCNHCPYVVASEREYIELQNKYANDGFQLIAINSNVSNTDYPADSYENMIKRANEKKFNFPYLADENQEISKLYGAQRTPEIFLFEDNKLVYKGRINDNPKELDNISRHDLDEAMKELLDKKPVSINNLPARGCTIKWIE